MIHYETCLCNMQQFLKAVKMGKMIDLYFFLNFAQNSEAVLTNTHNLCFKTKIRKQCLPL